jgi:SOS response regulatory protein OraA/RecX
MLGVSCLVKNTQLRDDLKDLVEYIGYNQIATGKEASVASVYNIIRKAGIEVDLQTVGHIYNEALPKSYSQFMSDTEVNDFVGKSYKDAIQRAAFLEQAEAKEKQIGEDAPEVYVTNGILNMFYNAEAPQETTKSDMLKMQDALWKGIQRKMNLPEVKKPKNNQEWKDILNQALGYEQLGMTDINGRLNDIADLYNAMRDQLQEAITEVKQQADPATFDRLNEMINGLEATTYSLLFSKGEAKRLLDEMMKTAAFGKKLKNGKTILDWNKLAGEIGSVQDLRENVQRVLEDNGFSQDVIDGVKNSLENEFTELHARVLEKAEKELAKRTGALERETVSKSDLRRLAELNNLGIFESSHDRLLYDLLGVGELQQEDIEDLKQIAQAASNLYRDIDKNYGSEVFASRQFQALQRAIDGIIARNINNKTKLLKVLSIIKNFFDVYLTGLLAGPLTIFENLYSGIKEIFVPTLMGAGLNKQDTELYWRMLSDVTARGQSFGEEVGSFAPRELYVNSLQWQWNGTDAKQKAESLLFALTIPARVGLLGFDSANKVTITNKTFKNAIYSALKQKGMAKEDIQKFMNEALYGQSFDKAKEQAKEILERTNMDLPDKYKIKINNNTISTLANDLVKANLNANGAINNEAIEAAYKSSYHVAGYGLGHEANNWFSKQIKGLRSGIRKEEQELAKNKDWNALAIHRMKSTFVNNMIIRFAAGASNWMYLRAQSGLGIGLVTGLMGKWNKSIDFDSKEKILQSIKDTQNARNKIGRALVGISVTALTYAIGYALVGGEDDEDKKGKLAELNTQRDQLKKRNARDYEGGSAEKAQSISTLEKEIKAMEQETSAFKKIKANWMGSRLFKKVAPDIMLLQYYMDTEKNNLLAVTKYASNTYGIGNQFSTASKVQEASELGWKGNTDAAMGQLSSIAGDRFGVPLWRAGKDWYKLGKWIGGGKVASDFEAPHNFADGVWGGGMLEDLGLYDRNPAITILPGIGAKGYELFKEKGITNMNDLKGEWWNTTHTTEAGNEVFILNATDRIKAKEAAEKYKDEK